MIDLAHEKLLTLAQAARLLPSTPHVSTLWRWATHGTRYGKLETVVMGGQRYTFAEALQRFAEASTLAANGERPAKRSAKQRERSIEAAERELAELGV